MSKKYEYDIVFRDGIKGTTSDFPVGVYRHSEVVESGKVGLGDFVYPVFDHGQYNNLYGRIMTLVEATTDTNRIKAVKDIFSKELSSWRNDIYRSSKEISEGMCSSDNMYNQ